MPIHLLSAEMRWLKKAPWSPQCGPRDTAKRLYVGERSVGVRFYVESCYAHMSKTRCLLNKQL